MAISLALKEATSDFRWVKCPWNDWEFDLSRESYGPFKRWTEEQRKKNPYFRQVAKIGQANMVLSPDSKVSERILGKIIGELDPADLEKLTALAKEGMAKVRIRGVKNALDEDGKENPYSSELILYMLSLEAPVLEWIDMDEYIDDDGNKKKDKDGNEKEVPEAEWVSLGDALFRFLVAQSGKLDQYRTDLLEAATKNFGVPSASI